MTDPSSWTVIIADGDPDSRQIVQRLLTSHGASVQTTSGGDDCLRLLQEAPPTVLLLGLQLSESAETPEPSGWDVIYAIRHDEALKDLLVVAIGNPGGDSLRQRTRAAGFNAFIEKPLPTLSLVDDLTALIDNQGGPFVRSILLIDDDPHVANVLRQLADYLNINLTIAANAESAFILLQEHDPDVIVSDIFLPGTDGMQAYRYIRQHMLAEHCPIVATSAYYTSDTEQEMKEWGFNGFLPKPFDLPRLIPYLEQVVRAQFDNPPEHSDSLSD